MKETNISKKAMLVHLRISQWDGKTKDSQVTREVLTTKHSENDAGAWWTYLVPPKTMGKVKTAALHCRHAHYRMTLPWIDGGLRILPAAMFMEYSKTMREAKTEYEKVIKNFLTEYPTLITQARKRLGRLFIGKDLPSVSQLKYKFRISTDILPIPTANDFRVDLGQEEVAEMKKNISTNIKTLTRAAMNELWKRFANLIEKVENTLGQPNKKFKNSLLTNLQDFCKLIPKMNVINDPELERVRKEMLSRLSMMLPDELRTNKTARRAAHKATKDVLKKMKGYTKL